jgi:SRSO17 transposase
MAHTVGTLADALDSFLSAHLGGLDTEARTSALAEYASGLALGVGSKSLVALARHLAPDNVEGCRQRMQRALVSSRFDAGLVFERIQATVTEVAGRQMQALCVDDTGIAKQGSDSVGVQRQYSGTLGKVGNCQIVTTLHGVSNTESFCLGGRLYLPESWTDDQKRRSKARIPESIGFLTKPEAALELIKEAVSRGVPRRPVLADAAYGDSRDFRDGLRELGLDFAVAISSNTMVWGPGVEPVVRARTEKRGRIPSRFIGSHGEQPVSVLKLAQQLRADGAFRKTTWRKGTKKPLSAHFARVRVRSAEKCTKGTPPSEPLWLLIELNAQEKRPFKFYLSSLPEKTPTKVLADLVKMRWRIEMDYRDMKQHLGLDEYEGRTWGGFRRHMAMVILMQVFVALHRERFSPRSETSMELEPVLQGASTSNGALA